MQRLLWRVGQRPEWLFFATITAYFAAQIALRLGVGGALETDEAEMLVMTPGPRLGYGPQLPLYNWLQLLVFQVFGRTLLALALLKNLLLWSSYALAFLGLRLWCAPMQAAIGALSLFLLPDIAFEAQRATTHSNMLLATATATLAAFLWALRSGRIAAWLTLGLVVGLGGLAKYNFWLMPLALFTAAWSVGDLRSRMDRRAMLVPALSAAVVAAPYAWMARNPELAFASFRKLSVDGGGGDTAGRLTGLADLAEGLVESLVLLFLVAGLARLLAGRRGPLPLLVRLLARAALAALALFVLAVIAGDIGHVTPRWLLPVAILAAPAAGLWALDAAGPRGRAGFGALLGGLAVLVFAGLVVDRYKPDARRAVDFAPLPPALGAIAEMPRTPVVAGFYVAGNLARLRPDWRIAPYLPSARDRFGKGRVLFLRREGIPASFAIGLRRAGWPDPGGAEILDRGRLSLPFETASDARLPIDYVLAIVP